MFGRKLFGITIREYLLILLGSALMALSITINAGVNMVAGGVGGLSIIIRYLSGILARRISPYSNFEIPIFALFLFFNIPLLLINAKQRGFGFIKKTILAVGLISLIQAVLDFSPLDITTIAGTGSEVDYLLVALVAGAMGGIGIGMVFLAGGTTGGTDLVATIIKFKRPNVTTAKALLVVDAIIIIIGGIVFGMRIGIYAIIGALISTKAITYILEGLRFGRAVHIISDKYSVIADAISDKLGRGSTAWVSKGMYTGREVNMLYVVIAGNQVQDVRALVYNIDPQAFVTITDVREVLGEGFGEYRKDEL